jgi:ABC-type transport system substrate-binding protein
MEYDIYLSDMGHISGGETLEIGRKHIWISEGQRPRRSGITPVPGAWAPGWEQHRPRADWIASRRQPIGDPVQPRLAECWDVSDDLMTYTFHLQDLTGLTFHDGTPLDAEAIAWSFNYWAQNPAISWMYGLTGTSEGVYAEVVDDRTITFQINEAVAPAILENYLGYIYILPRHVWEQYDENTIYDFENLEAIGTGPFKLAEWNPGQYIIFDVNDNYYKGKPPGDHIVIQYFAQQDSMVQALIAGDIDAIMNLPGSFADRLAEYAEITLFEKPPLYENHPFFDMYGDAGLGHPALMDPNVRMAVALAIDKQQIVDVAWGGHAIPSDSNWDGGARWEGYTHPTLKSHEFDLELATRILEQAGYLDSDGDGVREMNDGCGELLNFRLMFESDQAEQFATVEMIAEWLRAIGITTNAEALDPSTLKDVLSSTDFDLVVSQCGFDWDPHWQMFWLSSYDIDWGLNCTSHNTLPLRLRSAQITSTRRRSTCMRMSHGSKWTVTTPTMPNGMIALNSRFAIASGRAGSGMRFTALFQWNRSGKGKDLRIFSLERGYTTARDGPVSSQGAWRQMPLAPAGPLRCPRLPRTAARMFNSPDFLRAQEDSPECLFCIRFWAL